MKRVCTSTVSEKRPSATKPIATMIATERRHSGAPTSPHLTLTSATNRKVTPCFLRTDFFRSRRVTSRMMPVTKSSPTGIPLTRIAMRIASTADSTAVMAGLCS